MLTLRTSSPCFAFVVLTPFLSCAKLTTDYETSGAQADSETKSFNFLQSFGPEYFTVGSHWQALVNQIGSEASTVESDSTPIDNCINHLYKFEDSGIGDRIIRTQECKSPSDESRLKRIATVFNVAEKSAEQFSNQDRSSTEIEASDLIRSHELYTFETNEFDIALGSSNDETIGIDNMSFKAGLYDKKDSQDETYHHDGVVSDVQWLALNPTWEITQQTVKIGNIDLPLTYLSIDKESLGEIDFSKFRSISKVSRPTWNLQNTPNAESAPTTDSSYSKKTVTCKRPAAENNDTIRQIEVIRNPNPLELCTVWYLKEDEGFEPEKLWWARVEKDYCEVAAFQFATLKLEMDHPDYRWICDADTQLDGTLTTPSL